ncbi:MAG: hypothetical protein ACKOFW_04495, partial [Planctomycetaceae bacterium]
CEATLSQGGPWDAGERIVEGALAQLNDYIGHRPVAVLENRRRMQPYAHERFRPVPLFLKQVGVACSPYADLVGRTLEIIQTLPETMRREAHFDVALLDELALDLRAYDNSHPVYRRTNYLFGEWDPHLIDISGRYRRFVVREVILAALQNWVDGQTTGTRDERLNEAAAVLSGTMLMASSISGSGPDTHSSTISLTTLLPKVARQRDAFYQQLLQSMTGKHAERLRREAKLVQQPFGKIRQHLNLFLANHGCQQLQRSHLSWLYSRMGYGDAARRQARVIPAVSTRFESEIQLHISEALILLEGPGLEAASAAIQQAELLLHRGIECGALVDPWNIIGFQAHYPLFTSREDSVPDQRIDRLLILLEQLFKVTGRLVSEAAAVGRAELVESVLKRFDALAAWWDQFASTIVTDLHPVHGGAEADAARRVSRVLLAWHSAGESAGDVGFWKQHLADLDTPIAYGTVIELLLRKRDLVASMNLLIQWLSQGDTVPLQQGLCDFRALFECWIELATGDQMPGGPAERWNRIRVFFERIEVNAGDWGMAPQLTEGPGGKLKISGDALTGLEHPLSGTPFNPFELPGGEADPDSPENVFGAAYEGVVFRDSANDGQAGDTADDGPKTLETDLSAGRAPRAAGPVPGDAVGRVDAGGAVGHAAIHPPGRQCRGAGAPRRVRWLAATERQLGNGAGAAGRAAERMAARRPGGRPRFALGIRSRTAHQALAAGHVGERGGGTAGELEGAPRAGDRRARAADGGHVRRPVAGPAGQPEPAGRRGGEKADRAGAAAAGPPAPAVHPARPRGPGPRPAGGPQPAGGAAVAAGAAARADCPRRAGPGRAGGGRPPLAAECRTQHAGSLEVLPGQAEADRKAARHAAAQRDRPDWREIRQAPAARLDSQPGATVDVRAAGGGPARGVRAAGTAGRRLPQDQFGFGARCAALDAEPDRRGGRGR